MDGTDVYQPPYAIFPAQRNYVLGSIYIHFIEKRRDFFGYVDDPCRMEDICFFPFQIFKQRPQRLYVADIAFNVPDPAIVLYLFSRQDQAADIRLLLSKQPDQSISQMSIGPGNNIDFLHIKHFFHFLNTVLFIFYICIIIFLTVYFNRQLI